MSSDINGRALTHSDLELRDLDQGRASEVDQHVDYRDDIPIPNGSVHRDGGCQKSAETSTTMLTPSQPS